MEKRSNKSEIKRRLTYLFKKLFRIKSKTDKNTVSDLDINKYMGVWYEIARFENWFENGMDHVTATYILKSNEKIRVENRGRKNGKTYKSIGKAKQPTSNNPGKLKVSFFLWFYNDYYILYLDNQYRYSIVGSNSDKYLWILSREKNIDNTKLKELLDIIKDKGYNTDKLVFINQK